MDFTIEYAADENGKQPPSEYFRAELIDGVALIYKLTESTSELIVEQPWNPRGDGTNIDWNNIEEVVEWYKINLNV
jgi:hypothetical protein